MKSMSFAMVALLLSAMASCEDDDQNLIAQEQEQQPQEQPMSGDATSVVINEVRYRGEDTIELLNNGSESIDLAGYWLCLGPGTYVQIGATTPVSGNTNLASGEYLVINYAMPDEEGGLGLYSTNDFTNADALVDFVQWGSGGSARENIAVAAGQWTTGDFVPALTNGDSSIAYDGEGDSSSDWAETITVTLGAVNQVTEPMIIENTSFSITISNIVNYLDTKVFNTPVGATDPGPLTEEWGSYAVNFQAVPGTKLSFATMSVISNDWFFAPSGAGINLFENGTPVTGDITDQIYLWDSGTEEEDPATFTSAPGGAEAGEPDDDNTVRIVDMDATSAILVTLEYDDSTRYFTLTITNIRGASASEDPVVLSPGLVVLHAQDNPLFAMGEPDRELGLAKIAVQGNPGDLYAWFNETGTDGAPLRLSSSFTVFSPGVVYAFDSESDPVFTQGEAMVAGSGIEELAEDGNNGVMFEYITDQLGFPASKSNEMMPIGPGGSLTFELDVPQGYKLGFNTMFVFSNDWFLSYNNTGYELFETDGSPKSGTEATLKTYLFDAGTEVDQAIGFGEDQAPFQAGPNTGAADDDNSIRRVMEIEDVQFGKGSISSPAGVVGYADPRGGYNIVKVTVTPN